MSNRIITIDQLKRQLCGMRGIDRRAFCQATGVAVVTLALPACVSGGGRRVGEGALDDTDAGASDTPDFAGQTIDFAGHPVDLSRAQSPDLAKVQNACPGGYFDTGRAPGAFAMNTATYFANQDSFVCRDGGGLFAMSSLCTHAGCTLSYRVNSASFHCPCHSANFSYDGSNPTYPAFSPLDHYAICLQNDGNVGFDSNTIVGSTFRLNA